ncbi:hypothetical protein [Marinicellulosiphila megalodicopiae]|uniref:hypothetical protein n=1 Tax=Marinicellulosiphila megalodicopiae TaxID=2724896 RepID=UPI003BAE8F2A
MRNFLFLSGVSLFLSSCYIEVTDSHHHDYNSNENTPFTQITINQSLSYNRALLLSGYAMQLYTLSNQPHQLAVIANNDNLLNKSVLMTNLIDGDMLGIQSNDFKYNSINNICDYGSVAVSNNQTPYFDRYTLNNQVFDEYEGDFTFYTQNKCDITNSHSTQYTPSILDGALNYNIYFKNYISNQNSPQTDELIATISGNWSLENDNLGYWDIDHFQSQVTYQHFDDQIVWTEFSSNLSIHDHSRKIEGNLSIHTQNTLQTELGIIHPYSGSIIIQDGRTNNQLELKVYLDSVDIYVNGRILFQYIKWDDIIAAQSYFGLD